MPYTIGVFTELLNDAMHQQKIRLLDGYMNALMSLFRISFLLVTLLFPIIGNADSSPLVESDWLKKNMSKPGLVLLETQPLKFYQRAHLPGSVHTDYNRWRITNDDGLGKMLPKPDVLANLIGEHGIDNQSHVVIVPVGRGAGDMAAAARIYWSLHVAGLEQISILEGGLIGWHQAYGEDAFESGKSSPVQKKFTLNLREEQLMPMTKVEKYLNAGYSIVDARSNDEFVGLVSGAPNERPGALPTAVSLPYDSLMKKDGSGLLTPEQLKQRFIDAGAPLTGPQVSYCHTGHRTSLTWFVTHELLGNKDARLYDGSTLEWSVTDDQPLVTSAKQVK